MKASCLQQGYERHGLALGTTCLMKRHIETTTVECYNVVHPDKCVHQLDVKGTEILQWHVLTQAHRLLRLTHTSNNPGGSGVLLHAAWGMFCQ